ncbi:hypothetical protein VCHA35O141_180066 [Vibrio chagasii]|nr:hypothetical protein VCHA31O73_160067 [Vibrio chagasii]CAH6831739.1 hypothetical protein VCHA35O141_180066 [Vibrio chagasii]CAH7408091.1 hypothetical protein VCHA48P434_80173 [Vibrio chagasii]
MNFLFLTNQSELSVHNETKGGKGLKSTKGAFCQWLSLANSHIGATEFCLSEVTSTNTSKA